MATGLERLTGAEERVRDRVLAPLLRVIPGWVTPDLVTGLRLALVVASAALYLTQRQLGPQLLLLGAAAMTDALDGPLARSRGQTSGRGARFDHVTDWTLGGWLGVLSCLEGLVSLGLAVLMILPQAVLFGLNYRRRSDGVVPGFVPDTVSRLQFVAVISGFGLLLLGRLSRQRAALAAGYLLLYLEIAIALSLVGRTLLVSRSR